MNITRICEKYKLNKARLIHLVKWVTKLPKKDGHYTIEVEFFNVKVSIANNKIRLLECKDIHAKMAFWYAFNNRELWEEIKKEIEIKKARKVIRKEEYVKITNNNKYFWYNGKKGQVYQIAPITNNLKTPFVTVYALGRKMGILKEDCEINVYANINSIVDPRAKR